MNTQHRTTATPADYHGFTIEVTAKLHAISAQVYAACKLLENEEETESLIHVWRLLRTAALQIDGLTDQVDRSGFTYTAKAEGGEA